MTSPEWLTEENAAIELRRKKSGVDVQDPQVCGLALSGGGIRSATFCLGVVKALANNGVLTRFDYLSTVSGGGYAGAALGRLFQSVDDPAKVQRDLAKDDRLFWWWLRKNGRYLFPAGVRDTVFAASTLMRNLAAVYFDLFLVGALLSCLIILPHLVGMHMGREFAQLTSWSPSAWWIFAAIMPALFVVSAWAYWFSAAQRRLRVHPASIVFGLVGLLISALLVWPELAHQLLALETSAASQCRAVVSDTSPIIYGIWALGCLSSESRFVLLQLSLTIPLAVIAAWLAGRGADPARARNRLTRMLMQVLNFSVVIVVAAIIDMLSWWIAGTLAQGWAAVAASGGGLLVVIAAGRAILLSLKDLKPAAGGIDVARVAAIIGLLLGFLFLLLCATFVQSVVFYGGGFITGAPPMNEPEIWASQSAARLVLLVLPSLLYVVITGGNLASLNASSLHNFYRARLTRSYVSVGNATRGFTPDALAPSAPGAVDALTRVSNIVARDDIALAEYRPHVHGGPLHLINVCVNQTVDDRTGEFNRDRKGRNLTLSSVGCDLGSPTRRTQIECPNGSEPSLGQWIAISGAAAGPGMGARTSKGLASLLTLSGVRLGYWLAVASVNGARLKDSSFLRKLCPKYAHLLDEILATFPGSDDPHWYLSDGGHFENTGVYALLKRKVDVIVVADCGADPSYAFEDLNNLVRLARIDFNAEIIFQQPVREQGAAATLDISSFGTLAEIAAADNASFLVMARVEYASGKIGHLLIVKPTMIGTLPLDLMSYKSGNLAFPQQTTADQFFDEAQWESYFRLGAELGSAIDTKLLGNLCAISKCFKDQLGTGIVARSAERAVVATRDQPKFASEVVKSSIGVGAVAGLMFSFWQIWDQQRGTLAGEQRQYADAINKVVEKSVDSAGNLRVSDVGILLLEGAVRPGERSRTDINYAVAERLVARLNALCSQAPADDAANAARCKQLADLVQPAEPQGGRVVTNYWPGWPKENETAGVSMTTAPSVTAADANRVVLPPAAPIDLAAKSGRVPPAAAAYPSGDALGEKLKPRAPTNNAVIAAIKDPCARAAGNKVRLYPQVYGPDEFEALSPAAKPQRGLDLGGTVSVGSVSNVAAAAKKFGGAPPYQWSAPTLIYHDDGDRACAEKLAGVYENAYGSKPILRPLPERLKKQPDVIELWVPPGGAAKLVKSR